MLLLEIVMPLLKSVAGLVVPTLEIAFVGRLLPAGPILLFEIVLLSLPVAPPASVAKMILPPFEATVPEKEPCTEQLVITLFVAPPMNRMVDVFAFVATVVFAIVSALPMVFNPL